MTHFNWGHAIIFACLEYPFLRWVQLPLTMCLICPQMFHEILHCTQQKLALIHCLRKQISMYNRTARRELPPSYASKTACGSYHLYFSSPLLLYQNSEACHIVMQRFLHLVLCLQYPDFGSFCSRWWEEPVEVEGQGVKLFVPAVPSECPEPLPPLHPPVLRRVSDI